MLNDRDHLCTQQHKLPCIHKLNFEQVQLRTFCFQLSTQIKHTYYIKHHVSEAPYRLTGNAFMTLINSKVPIITGVSDAYHTHIHRFDIDNSLINRTVSGSR